MSDIKTLVKQSSHYFFGQAAVLTAGFLSFPILTRIFSVSDYGIMSLATTTMFIAVAIVKFGMPNSIVRFYAEYCAAGQQFSFFTTIFTAISVFAVTIGFVSISGLHLLAYSFGDKKLVSVLSIVALLIITGSMNDILMSFLRAEQRTKLFNLIAISRRYLSLALGIAFAMYLAGGVKGFFVGQLVSGACILLVLLFVFKNKFHFKKEKNTKKILKSTLKFGFPLVWAEFGHLLLNYIDRFIIQFYLGAGALGIYTAGYNLATHITEALVYPINYAITPIYMSILVEKGERATKEFFTKIFSYVLMILLPVVFGSIAVGRDMISVLASIKYLESYNILSYVLVGQAIYACTIILNNGLFINKKTHIYNNIMIVTCIINILLNMIMVPAYGIEGAAQATLISYILFAIVVTFYSFREFSFDIDYRRITIYVLSSVIMFVSVKLIFIENIILKLMTQFVDGVVVYITVVLLFDTEMRQNILSCISQRYRHD